MSMTEKENFLLFSDNKKPIIYSTSIAATWIWAPEIYVTSQMGFYNGIWGPLFFTIPATLTLILFGYFASLVRQNQSGFTLGDISREAGKAQYSVSIFTSICLLICSTAVQLLGLFVLLNTFFEVDKPLAAIILSIIALSITFRHGLKLSIITDHYKLLIMIFLSLFLFLSPEISLSNFDINGLNNTSFIHLAMIFGITSAIGHFTSPYVDQTFWQRVFSIDKKDIKKRFFESALVFIPIPVIFGLLGLLSPHNIEDFNIIKVFTAFPFNIIISGIVICALISTLDSNLCAISSLTWNELNLSDKHGKLLGIVSMVVLLALANSIVIFTNIGIVQLFLVYGTLRTCVGTSMILIILKKFNKKILPYLTIISTIVCTSGFIIMQNVKPEYAFIFTLLALFIPLLAFQRKQNEI